MVYIITCIRMYISRILSISQWYTQIEIFLFLKVCAIWFLLAYTTTINLSWCISCIFWRKQNIKLPSSGLGKASCCFHTFTNKIFNEEKFWCVNCRHYLKKTRIKWRSMCSGDNEISSNLFYFTLEYKVSRGV